MADVIVIGAGVSGSSIAVNLAKSGARVVICDRGDPGQASQASAGMLAPLSEAAGPSPFLDLALESLRVFEPLAEELRERTGIDVGYRRSGVLRVALSAEEERELRTRRTWQQTAGLNATWLDPTRARDAEPALIRELRGALYYPQEHQVSAPALVRALSRGAADLGATFRMDFNVSGFLRGGDRVVGIRGDQETLRASQVVIANGAWAGAWSQELGVYLPISPVRGQMIALRTIGTPLRHIIFSHDGYIASKAEGLTYVGATVEEVGFDARPTAAGVAQLLSLVPRLAPGLGTETFSHAWAGLRPATPDRMPILGRVPDWQNLYIAGGHFRNGILLAPITGILISDLIQHGRPRLPLDAFDPVRFLAPVGR